jgi:cell wall assembly regulator SMI1
MQEYIETGGGVVRDWWHPKWIPLTSDGCGNSHCLDLNPGPTGAVGQIIIMWHDDPSRPVEAGSFRIWLEQFATDLESGKYVYLKNEGVMKKDKLSK